MSLTYDENQILDYLENSFMDEVDDYESAEYILSSKTTNPKEIRKDFVNFIEETLAEKVKSSLNKDQFKKIYKSSLDHLKKKVLENAPAPNIEKKKQNSQPLGISDQPNLPPNRSKESSLHVDNLKNEAKIQKNAQEETEGAIKITKDIVCFVEYRKIKMKELKKNNLILNFMNTFTGNEIVMPYPNMPSYSLVEEINVNDELGEWTYDHLQNCMKIYFKMIKGPLPRKFIIKKDFFLDNPKNVEYIKEFKEKSSDNIHTHNITLEKFLQIVVEVNQKDPSYVELWKQSLKKQHVEKFEEILAWDEKNWDDSNIEVNAKKLIQKQLNSFKYKSNLKLKSSFSKAERYSITHRIKRFLIWKTDEKELSNIEHLDERALGEGFNEIRKEYIGEYLLQQLETFYESYAIPKSYSKSLMLSRGMLLYGPPGTGKTMLTDTLPSKIGLTQISYPLCAAEVNRSLVGQTEKLLMELANRATRIPYLLCCVAIDEIDGLAPKRDEKSSQHKVDALAVLLSVIGGIKDVPNLIFLASTNRLNQMDDAFKRRLSGQFFVGRPSPKARKTIIDNSEGTGLDKQMVDQAVMMTSNFSGAALKQFISYVVTEVRKLNKNSTGQKQITLSYEQLADIAARTSKQFNIKLGNYSLPELFALQKQKERLLSLPFLRSLDQNKAIIIFRENYLEVQFKRDRITSTTGSEVEYTEEIDNQKIITKQECKDFFTLLDEISGSLKQTNDKKSIIQQKSSNNTNKNMIETNYITLVEADSFTKKEIMGYVEKKIKEFDTKAKKNPNKIFVIMWDDPFQAVKSSELSKLGEKEKNEILSFFTTYFNQNTSPKNLYNLYVTSELTYKKFLNFTDWGSLEPFNKKKLKFTGRILIDMNDEDQEMRFQLDEEGDGYQLHSEPLFLEKKASNSFQVLPKLVEFAFERGVDFILLMDQDFLLSNNAFDESKIKENITEKMQEFNCYEKSLLIIDVDSMVGMVRSVSESSMGISTSYNLSDSKLYSMIIHYANTLPKILPKSEYWVALITKNQELTNMIKKDLSWPKTVKELEEDEEMEKLQEEVRCVRCDELYIEAKNELTSCHYHDGDLFESTAPSYNWKKFDVEEAKKEFVLKSKIAQANQNKDPQFLHLCCLESLKSQGCKKGKHISNLAIWEEEKSNQKHKYDSKFKNLKQIAINDEKF